MFIRMRQSTKHPSYQIIETYREGGKVKQRVIYNLGHHPTIEEALKAKYRSLKMLQEMRVPIGSIGAAIADHKADIANLEAIACVVSK